MTPHQQTSSTDTASPAATGQAGGVFEQHVDALFLSLLLVQGLPPIIKDSVVEEVRLQTAYAGWATDDVLVLVRNGGGEICHLALQVKRTITVSASDTDCVETVSGFWKDFNDSARFNKERDRLAIVVQHGSKTLMQDFAPLLDCARACRDAADFQSRLEAKGYLSKKAHTNNEAIRKICDEANGSAITDQQLWAFLKVIHVLSYDLATATAQTESLVVTMLTATATGHDKKTASISSWNHLVKLAGESMGTAKSFRRDALPSELLTAHVTVSPTQHEALSTLASHGNTVLNGIKDSIGRTVTLERGEVQSKVASAIADSRVVIVSGPAGVGKSAVAKHVVEELLQDHFVFSFRAEEFATAHLDTTLRNAGVKIPADELQGILAAQSRKLVLVESVERLLEHATRDAFSDLLQILNDKGINLVLTCRSYSLEIVRASLIVPLGVPYEIVNVPELNDSELEEVAKAIPTLNRPLESSTLKKIFRNVYILDKAALMDWPSDAKLPQNERAFRKKFWSEIVRKDQETAGGFPQRRERALQEIALRRARALTPYAECSDLDSAVVEALKRDDLVSHPRETQNLAATAHDVLEDWALIGWIDEQFYAAQGDYAKFLQKLDASPAIRRAYRRWLQEMLECEPKTSDALIEYVLKEPAISPQLRDDTCVSTLLASSCAEFLAREEKLLLANECEILIRMIHLLRIACVEVPFWVKESAAQSSFFVPSGASWQATLKLVYKHLDKLLPKANLLVLGLIDDFARGVAWWNSYPPGSKEAAEIAHKLLPDFEDYDFDEQRKTALEVIAKIPRAAPEKFLALIELARGTREERRSVEDFVEIVLEGMTCFAAARDYPDEMIGLAESQMLLAESDVAIALQYGDGLGVDTAFGISHKLHKDFFPASAYRGFFLPLLRKHSEKGVAYLLRLFNHAADCYVNPKYGNSLEPAYEVEITLPDGTSKKQWCNSRLWRLYRGTSVGPYVLQSALMALELYLSKIPEIDPDFFRAST
ncbi:NACHT domain-containing protein [Lacipirellula sp.]|uniref:NACHT domain-containing protein n=1 Tax=Lacipirellula sp. TaxID=2691419 RepID=UPI003D11B882